MVNLDLKIAAYGEPVVTIRPDGEVVVNPKFTVTDAAKAFWEAVEAARPVAALSATREAGEPVAWPDFAAPPQYDNPAEGWSDPRLPDFRLIWKTARSVGYSVGLHGSMKRDCDLIATPWIEDAQSSEALIEALCRALNARQVGEVEQKPHGRVAVTLQIDGYFKPIDLSIAAAAPAEAERGVVTDHVWKIVDRLLVDAYGAGSSSQDFDMLAAKAAVEAAFSSSAPAPQPAVEAQGAVTLARFTPTPSGLMMWDKYGEWVDRSDCMRALASEKARADRLDAALRDARDEVEHWGQYAGDYFQEKHGLDQALAAIDAALRPTISEEGKAG